jgi:Tfp pilus assembly protein FimV
MSTVPASTAIRYRRAPQNATAAPQLPSTRLRMTVRGRRVVALLVALPAALAVGAGMIAGGSALAARDDGAPSTPFETVTVVGGDTLWSLAEDVAPSADPRDVVDAIARLNALDGVTIKPGQRLAIPAEYATGD